MIFNDYLQQVQERAYRCPDCNTALYEPSEAHEYELAETVLYCPNCRAYFEESSLAHHCAVHAAWCAVEQIASGQLSLF